MSEYESVPHGGAPTAPAPGWYPDPAAPGQARFWDGRGWSDQAAPAPTPASPGPASLAGPAAPPVGGVHHDVRGAGFGPVFYIGVVFVVLAVILGVVVFVVRHAGSANGSDSAAVGACRYFVSARLQNPASAEFSHVEAIAPVTGDRWTVTGTVKSDTTTGRVRRMKFTCAAQPVSGGWRLVSLRFPRR